MSAIKIIPVLLCVAMLSFSLKLVEVVSGVSTLANEARAEAKAEPKPEPKAEADADSKAESKPAAAMAEKAAAPMSAEAKAGTKADENVKGAPKVDVPAVEWRDASDEAPGDEKVKMEVFDDLSKRREGLNKKERDLQTREALLKAAEQELSRKYQELSQLRQEIENLLGKQSEEEKARVQSLVKIYEGMKPKEAARIFDTLDLDILVGVMSKMSERKLSPVLAAMNPERARTVTVLLAEEKKLPSLPPEQ